AALKGLKRRWEARVIAASTLAQDPKRDAAFGLPPLNAASASPGDWETGHAGHGFCSTCDER
ncbi:MAG: hypothetical protein RLZZ515_2629, partial [Cyanobacteriota bacterium]